MAMACVLAGGAAWAQVIEPYQPDEHTLLLYHFDGEGDQIIDSGPLGLDATLTQGPVERVEGVIGKALRMGEGQAITLPDRPELRGMDQLTVELWFNTHCEDLDHRQRTVVFWDHYLISLFEHRRFVGHIYGADGEKFILSGPADVQPNTWYHAAITYDGKRARLWFNGREIGGAKMTGPVNDAAGTARISMPTGDGFIGDLDEVRISSIARQQFIGPRQLDVAHVACDLGLSPGTFRAVFTPVVPQGTGQVQCRASLSGGAEASMTIAPDALQPIGDLPWVEGKGDLVLPVPAGVEGADRVTCAISYDQGGEPRSIERQFAVRVEEMVPPPAVEFRGAWTHSHAIEDPEDLFSRMQAGGLNAAVMRVRRGETAYFNSKLGPVVKLPFDNESFMEDTIAASARHGIDLHCYVNNFPIGTPQSEWAQQALADGRWQKDPDGKDIDWLCPSDPRNVELVTQGMVELAGYPIRGVQYDFIRFPNDRGCYCERCRAKFEERIGRAVGNWPADVLAGGELYEQYTDFRCDLITNAVRVTSAAVREVNPDILISAAVFAMPPESARHSVGQDWARWAHEGLVDALCPMSYVQDTQAFEQTVKTILDAVEGTVPVYAGIGVRSGNGVMHYPEEMAAKINTARRLGAPGFNMFCVTPPTDVPEAILIPLRDSVLAGDGRG